MVPRSAHPRSATRPTPGPHRQRALLLCLLTLATALAGCHGLPHDAPPAVGPSANPDPADDPDNATTGTGAPDPTPTGRNELPLIQLSAERNGADTTLIITLDGDPASIATHRIDFGDDSKPIERDGAPAQRYAHTYPAPRDYRHFDNTFTASLILNSAQGHTRAATLDIKIPAPPNQAPVATLKLDHTSGAPPLRTLIHMNGHDTDGTIQSWRLDLGDGTAPIIGPDVPKRAYQHDYRIIGTHTIRLTLTDDRGREGHTETTVTVLPPPDVRIWTVDRETQHVTMQTGNGTTKADYDVRRPTCGRATTCETPIDIATGAGYAYALLHRPQADGTVWVLDAETGRGRYHVTVGLHPDAVWTDPAGHAWVTHETSGTIARIAPGNHRATFIETQLDNHSAKRLVFSSDGQHAWALGRGDPALVVHIDPTTNRVDPVPLPAGLDPVALTYQDTHGAALIAGADGRIVYVGWENGLPTLRDVVDTAKADGASVNGFTCHGRDHCWVALGPGNDSDAEIVRIPARPDPLAAATRTLARTALPAPLVPTGLAARDDAVVVTIGGDGAHGTLFVDPATASVARWAITNTSAPGARDAAPHATQAHLVYADAPDIPGWRIIDTRIGRIVHEARLPYSADAFTIARASHG